MEWVETTGRTLEEAKDQALDQLGVTEDEAEFEVLEEPKQGLFGRTRGEARVRARVRPSRPRPKVERKERKRTVRTAGSSSSTIPADETADATDDAPATPKQPRRTAASTTPRAESSAQVRAPKADANGADDGADEVDEGAAAASFLEGLARALGVAGTATIVELDQNDLEVRLDGDELGVLVGPRGQTLTAVQDLTRLVAQRSAGERRNRLRIDIAGYRERRTEALSKFTRQVADQVLSTGEAKALEPMSPADRKVVHDTANSIDGVRTVSEGEDSNRRVVILPDA